MNIFVIGCGRWGSLITWYLDHIGHHVTLYGRQSSPRMQSFLATRQNDLLTLPDSVGLTTDLRDVEQAETVIISIGSQSLRSLLAEAPMQALRGKTDHRQYTPNTKITHSRPPAGSVLFKR